jgi:hypothetical protein
MIPTARYFSLCLAAVALAGCGKEPLAPAPQTATKVAVSPSSYTAAELASFDTATAQAAGVRLMDVDVLGSVTTTSVSSFSTTTASGSSLSTTKTSKGKLKSPSPDSIIAFYYPLEQCTLEYIECVYKCLDIRLDFQITNGDFWRAESDFFDNFWSGKSYLNGLRGGPAEKMTNTYYMLSQYRNQFQSLGCKKYIG